MPDNAVREWLNIIAAALSALFAGLIWQLARKRLSNRYSIEFASKVGPSVYTFCWQVLNRGDADIIIEAVSVDEPFSLLVSEDGSYYGSTISKDHAAKARRVQRVNFFRRVRPEETYASGFAVGCSEDFDSYRSVSIALYILKSFPVTRHKKKVLTAILPASTKSAAA